MHVDTVCVYTENFPDAFCSDKVFSNFAHVDTVIVYYYEDVLYFLNMEDNARNIINKRMQ